MTRKSDTPISSLGRFGLARRIASSFMAVQPSTVRGMGEAALVTASGDNRFRLTSNRLLLEGVHFDLTYFPLQHLGYKAVVVAVSELLAMNGTPRQVMLSAGISARFSVEMIDRLFEWMRVACAHCGADPVEGDLSASVNGLMLSVTAVGEVEKETIAYRSGAGLHDLICVTGDLGAAYMGLHLLEREKRAFDGHPNPQPEFAGHEYILGRQLHPAARTDVVAELAARGIVPTAMTAVTDGLAAAVIRLAGASERGARIYLERIPVAAETSAMAEELHNDPVVALLNGGDDYELLFTVPVTRREDVAGMGVDIIGHITDPAAGTQLVTPDGQEIALQAQGFGPAE